VCHRIERSTRRAVGGTSPRRQTTAQAVLPLLGMQTDCFRPIWLDEAASRRFPPLLRDASADVAVIGAGITGLTLALLLQRQGRSVILLERHQVARAATAHTSGHLTAVPDASLRRLLALFGEEGARAAIAAATQAIDFVSSTCDELAPGAGFLRVPAFRYTLRQSGVQELQDEAAAAERLGLHASVVQSTPLPFEVAGALRFESQALFHPLRYCDALAEAFVAAGGSIYEESAVEEIEEDEPCRLKVGGFTVRAGSVVHATQSPVGRVIHVQARLVPLTTYVLVARLAAPAPLELFWDDETPYHYVRPYEPGDARLIIGGCDHKTGEIDDGAPLRLESWARQNFPVEAVERRWSFGFFDPTDGLPYIGRLGNGPIFTASGYSGVGLSFGTAAARLLCDEILGVANPLGEVLRASRVGALASAPAMMKHNAKAALHLIRERLGSGESGGLSAVARGEGRVVEFEGHKAAVHRDEAGRLHVMSPVCTHLGCVVHWNAGAETWDCPCHGGRYLPDGTVLYGPPPASLEALEPQATVPEPAARPAIRPGPSLELGGAT
jgi:glycine/D-amino acid oxidase-like deaminating enzyme/nitrite reductase/ring-hydroxylating ferredoxin subunit